MKLKDFRKSRGMTLDMLATELGCCVSSINKYERNVATVPDWIIDTIKEKYGVTIEKEYCDLAQLKVRIKHLESVNKALVDTCTQLKKENKKLLEKYTKLTNKVKNVTKDI